MPTSEKTDGCSAVNDKSSFNNTALLYAANHGKDECANFLIDNGADVNIANDNGYCPLITASLIGATGIVQSLLKAGADVNQRAIDEDSPAEPVTALEVARRNRRHDVVKLLEQHGANT